VEIDLAEQPVRQKTALTVVNGGSGLIAGRLNTQDSHVAAYLIVQFGFKFLIFDCPIIKLPALSPDGHRPGLTLAIPVFRLWPPIN
jgi:hypothetical protein